MIPVKLIIEGLYSYQNRQVIDFTKLTSDHIFGIFGKVGSGKSTVLEAITFALFGKTDRLLLSGDNRNYNMMNLKSNQLFIEFDFKAGAESQLYRIQVSAKRNSKKFEDVKKADRIIYKSIDNEYTPITESELEQTLGLSYDNFKRTIIIPQGRFQEFLQLKASERTQMMKELFGLEKYELFHQVKSLEAKNNGELQNLKGRLEQIGELSSENVEILSQQQLKIKEELLVKTKNQHELDSSLKTLEKQKENKHKLEISKTKIEKLKFQEKEIQLLEVNLQQFEYCLIHFKNTLDSIQTLKNKCEDLQIKQSKDKVSYQILTQELSDLQSKLKEIESDFKNLDALKLEQESILKIREIFKIDTTLSSQSDRLKKGETSTNEVILNIELAEKKIESDKTELARLKANCPNIEELSSAKEWFSEQKNLSKQIYEVENNKKQLESQKSEYLTKLLSQTKELRVDSDDELFSNRKNKLQILIDDLNSEIESKLKLKENLLIKSGLNNYAQNLENGSPCPLCGSLDHPHPLNSEDLNESIQITEKEIDSLNKKTTEYKALLMEIDKTIEILKPLQTQKSKSEEKLNDLRSAIDLHQKHFNNKFASEEIIAEQLKQYKISQTKITELEKILEDLSKKLDVLIKNKERYTSELNKIQRDIDVNTNSKNLLLKQIPYKTLQKYNHIPELKLDSISEELKLKITNIEKSFQTITNQLEEKQKLVAELSGKINANATHLDQINKELIALESKLQTDIDNSDFENTKTIKGILELELDISTSKNRIKQYYSELEVLESEIKTLNELLLKSPYNEEKHKLIQNQNDELKVQITHLNKELGSIETSLKTLEEKLQQKHTFEEEIKKLSLRAEDLETLRKMFFKSGFVNYISTVYLQNLCVSANERFHQMTKQSLSLELNNDNNFEVRDYLNEGKLRSIKTLSGGQTFQAALCLALALSDHIQSSHQTNQNFFFLDEGFGSLDKESLEIVFNTLKGLRKENRIVGVISHVEEMQQEITTFLDIKKNDDSGSYIQFSWNK